MPEKTERERPRLGALADFDMDYFRQLEGENGWIAIGQDNCSNQRYFTVKDVNGERLGIVGIYDTDEDKNITHTVVDPKYRGLGLAQDFKTKLLDELGENFYVATVDLDNVASLHSMEKTVGAKVVSDAAFEQEFHKRKYRFDRPEKE